MQPMEAGEIDVATIHGVDLNSIWHFSEGFRGGACEQWQDAFRPAHGLSAMEHVHADCLAVWRGLAGADIVLRRAVSSHGVCPVDPAAPGSGRHLCHGSWLRRFRPLQGLHLAGAFFITRAKSNMNAHRVYSAPTDRATGIICDQTIALDGHYTSQHYPEHLRRIRLRDAESGKTLVFLTNQFGLPAATVCALYKSRWQVELFSS